MAKIAVCTKCGARTSDISALREINGCSSCGGRKYACARCGGKSRVISVPDTPAVVKSPAQVEKASAPVGRPPMPNTVGTLAKLIRRP